MILTNPHRDPSPRAPVTRDVGGAKWRTHYIHHFSANQTKISPRNLQQLSSWQQHGPIHDNAEYPSPGPCSRGFVDQTGFDAGKVRRNRSAISLSARHTKPIYSPHEPSHPPRRVSCSDSEGENDRRRIGMQRCYFWVLIGWSERTLVRSFGDDCVSFGEYDDGEVIEE